MILIRIFFVEFVTWINYLYFNLFLLVFLSDYLLIIILKYAFLYDLLLAKSWLLWMSWAGFRSERAYNLRYSIISIFNRLIVKLVERCFEPLLLVNFSAGCEGVCMSQARIPKTFKSRGIKLAKIFLAALNFKLLLFTRLGNFIRAGYSTILFLLMLNVII